MKEAKALARLRRCAGSSEPQLLAYAISIKIQCAGPFVSDFQEPLECKLSTANRVFHTGGPNSTYLKGCQLKY